MYIIAFLFISFYPKVNVKAFKPAPIILIRKVCFP
jgi:hypothetical protein